MKEIRERIVQLRSELEQSQEDFAQKNNVTRSQQAKFELGITELPIEYLLSIVQNTGITYDWLFYGKEPQFQKRKSSIIKARIAAEPGEQYGIPLVGVDAFGGTGNTVFSIEEKDIQSRYVVPDFVNINFMMRVKGSSMYPKYNSGDVIACRIIKQRSFIQWGKAHVISTKEQGILIKRLKKSEKKEHVLAISDNPGYDPFDIPNNEIDGIALVVGVIRLE